MIEMLGAQSADPEIKQDQIAQRAVEKFGGEGAVRRNEIAGPEQSGRPGYEPLVTAEGGTPGDRLQSGNGKPRSGSDPRTQIHFLDHDQEERHSGGDSCVVR